MSSPDGPGGTYGSILWNSLVCGETIESDFEGYLNQRGRMKDVSLWLRSTGCGIDDLLKLVSFDANGKPSINKDVLKGRLNSAMNGTINTLVAENKDALMATLKDITGEMPEEMEAFVNDVKTFIPSGDITKIKSFKELMDVIPGTSNIVEFFDIAAEVAMFDTILNQAVGLGISDAAIAIIDQIRNDRAKRKVLRKQLLPVAMASDIPLLTKIVDELGSAAALAEVSNLVEVVLGYYKFTPGTTSSDYVAKKDQLLSLLSKINSNWHSKLRNGVWVSNLEPFVAVSKHAFTLLNISEYSCQAAIAKRYRKSDYQSIVKKYNPYVVLSVAV